MLARIVLGAALAGSFAAPVLAENMNADEARSLIERADAQHRVVVTGYSYSYYRHIQQARAAIAHRPDRATSETKAPTQYVAGRKTAPAAPGGTVRNIRSLIPHSRWPSGPTEYHPG